jgi:hypothetical protein
VLLPGAYRHKSGDLYVVEGTVINCTNSETDKVYVLYWSLKHGPNKKFVRDIEEFQEVVRWPDNRIRPRFVQEVLI